MQTNHDRLAALGWEPEKPVTRPDPMPPQIVLTCGEHVMVSDDTLEPIQQ